MTAIWIRNVGTIATLVRDTCIDIAWHPVVTIHRRVAAVGLLHVVACIGREVTTVDGTDQSVIAVLGVLTASGYGLMQTLLRYEVTGIRGADISIVTGRIEAGRTFDARSIAADSRRAI